MSYVTNRSGGFVLGPLEQQALNYVRRHRHSRIVAEIARIADRVVKAHENQWYDFATNGEALVLRCLARVASTPPTVFDVGANVGDWTRAMLRILPMSTVHAFELVPSTARLLHAAHDGDPRVVINEIGLADSTRETEVTTYSHDSTVSSLFDLPHQGLGAAKALVRATLTTGDEYALVQGVSRIDFLKIDVEGAEWFVLQGFRGLLQSRAIRAVQFEYGRANIVTHRLLCDFYAFFREHGYVVGKIYPDGVAFSDYQWEQEDFIGPNYLAVHADDTELLAAIPQG